MSPSPPRKRRGFWLFFPFFLFVLLVAAYSLYWFWARNLLSQGIDDWIEGERRAGRIVEFSSKHLGGYPFRFALHLADPVYEDPRTGRRWSGEELQLVMQPWNWQHVIARSPGRNSVQVNGAAYRLELGKRSAGSLSWTNDGIRRVSLAIDTLDAFDGDTALGRAEGFEFHLRPAPGEPEMLQLQTQWQAIELARPIPDAEFLGNRFGPSILRAEAAQAIPALERTAELARLPRAIFDLGGDISLAQLELEWGPADIGARGRLDRDPAGQIDGQIDIRLERHEDLKTALEAAGRLETETARAIDMVAAASRGGEFLSMTIRNDGLYFLGNRIVEADIVGAL